MAKLTVVSGYSVQVTEHKPSGKASGFLLEDGIQIAKITLRARERNFIHTPEVKFFTDRSRGRFEDFCDSISISECVEALGFPR